jgi:uncharacterized protein YndB with AHSA1/START domain
MPTARRSRTISAPVEEVWSLVRDPHHLPRWWPRVTRVEDVQDGAFTEVMLTRKGKVVRADFNVVATDEHTRALTWAQRIQGTPFARLLSSAETEVRLAAFPPEAPDAADAPDAPDAAALARARAGAQVANATEVNATEARATEVTIELRQTLTGLFPRLGGVMVRRAAAATIDEALDGLERISV